MAALVCGLPDPNTGAIYYGRHRYEQWIPKEVTVVANEQELSELRPVGEVIYPRGPAHVRTWDGSAKAVNAVDENAPITARQDAIIGRLDAVHNQLGGCRKALESLVGCPMDGEARKPDEPSCTVARLQDLIEHIESDVQEVSHQINRLSESLG